MFEGEVFVWFLSIFLLQIIFEKFSSLKDKTKSMYFFSKYGDINKIEKKNILKCSS